MDDAEEGDVPGEATARPYDTATEAPIIGAVRSLPEAHLAAGVRLRAAQVELDGLVLGSFAMAAASIAGIAHTVQGAPRQDAYNAALADSGEVCLVVADGLGSRDASALGARLLCDAVVALALDGAAAGGDGLRALVHRAGTRAAEIASAAYGADPGSIACVCVVAIVRDDHLRLARVGDATAFVLRDGQFVETFPHREGVLNVVDASVPTADEGEVEIVERSLDGTILALVSDGLATDLRTSPVVRKWLARCWAQPIGPFAMGESLRYRRQGSHDDRTALALWARPRD